MSTKKKFSDVNLYDLLGVAVDGEQVDIRKAYRKKALECHPDKNPDNPKAAELFHELSKALEILTDATARAAYDNVIKAKKAAELRTKQLDSKRQKLKSDLEQRERDALHKLYAGQAYTTLDKSDEEVLEQQIKRLRQEGSKLLEEEQRLMREQLKQNVAKQSSEVSFDSAQHRIKIKWKADKHDTTNGGYTKGLLENFLKKYGDIIAIVMSKKNGSALIEFKKQDSGEMAIAYEKGIIENPLELSWVTAPQSKSHTKTSNTITDRDFEDLVMRKMRQAEERKRLIEQLQKEEDDNT